VVNELLLGPEFNSWKNNSRPGKPITRGHIPLAIIGLTHINKKIECNYMEMSSILSVGAT
jgi:hypothetical protein